MIYAYNGSFAQILPLKAGKTKYESEIFMLTLKKIVKQYPAGDTTVDALRGIDIEFRKSEFVAILGPSGCGKTTLLNIVGGLDKYTEGDLVINGVSTKQYKDADWDTYRNHSIGFVFQSYNLIPHQTVLANVELALTLSGVSKAERRKRAKEALEKVGLGDQLTKRPNQMSGGQMQRVAIARALVNDPEIILADEPTGALDSQTSVQIMELLKEISRDKLIIMVTHNPDLAEQYATRTIKLIDGQIVEDSAPYSGGTVEFESKECKKNKKKEGKGKKAQMSFFTALSLSLNNLLTKKTRTILTSFAGSIGIIGIALILSVSYGVKAYIDQVQKDTLASYPIMLQHETVDMTELIMSVAGTTGGTGADGEPHDLDRVYANNMLYELMNKMNNLETETNDLKSFKKFLETDERFKEYVSGVQYSYDLDMNVFTKDTDGKIIRGTFEELMDTIYGQEMTALMQSNPMMASFSVWQELLSGKDDQLITPLLHEQYDVIYGDWPKAYNEIVLVVDKNNEITDITLYQLGLKTADELKAHLETMQKGEDFDLSGDSSWSYEDICSKEFKLVLAPDIYQKQSNGNFVDLSASEAGLDFLYHDEKAVTLKITGIIRPNDDAVSSMITGSIGYTKALTEHIINETAKRDIVSQQLADTTTDVFTGLPFATGDEIEPTPAQKAESFAEYAKTADDATKAIFYKAMKSEPSAQYLMQALSAAVMQMTEEQKDATLIAAISAQMSVDAEQVQGYIASMTPQEKEGYLAQILTASIKEQYKNEVLSAIEMMPEAQLAVAFDAEPITEEQYTFLYDNFMPATVSEATYEENLKLLGYVDIESPSVISIFANTFENKDEIAALITEYNKDKSEEERIEYTDYVAILMSSITTIIDAISYVLIAFVAISLVVSSIMIGIITYISVLERTKEIGILRSIGASKKDISRVFNAETLIVGFGAGAIGIVITYIFDAIITAILHALTGINTLNAILLPEYALILVAISMILTFVAGLIPSGIAAKKDPVVALRTE